MKKWLIYLILGVMIITHGTFFFMGINFENSQNEKEIDLTYEAAAMQYEILRNDSTKYDKYGNLRTETDTTKRVLPQNSRTKSHLQQTTKNAEISQTRKRN